MDLRSYTLDLLGVRFKKPRAIDDRIADKDREFTIEEVYQHQVRCFTECENGRRIYESFSTGDLIHMGILQSKVDHVYGKKFYNGYGL